jgi:tRNA pseudouridine38-40 synthase
VKLKAVISYHGGKFHGSQVQNDKDTVANAILKALKKFNINTQIDFSGRTDRGVHATYQVISFDVDADIWSHKIDVLRNILNKALAKSVYIKSISIVDDTFHARYSAKKRVYRYLITDKQTTPFNDDLITHVDSIDYDLLQEATKKFIGVYDFEYFSKLNPQIKSTVRTMYDARFYKYKDIYVFKFEANGFLRSQIRVMVGFLLAVSKGKLTLEDLENQLQKKEQVFNRPAPSNGLYLSKVKYR